MGKILKYVREDNQVHMFVELDSGAKEKWTYERQGNDLHQVNREDAR